MLAEMSNMLFLQQQQQKRHADGLFSCNHYHRNVRVKATISHILNFENFIKVFFLFNRKQILQRHGKGQKSVTRQLLGYLTNIYNRIVCYVSEKSFWGIVFQYITDCFSMIDTYTNI